MCFPCLGGGRGEKGRGREARRRGEAKGGGVLMNCDAPLGEGGGGILMNWDAPPPGREGGGIRLANHNAYWTQSHTHIYTEC